MPRAAARRRGETRRRSRRRVPGPRGPRRRSRWGRRRSGSPLDLVALLRPTREPDQRALRDAERAEAAPFVVDDEVDVRLAELADGGLKITSCAMGSSETG